MTFNTLIIWSNCFHNLSPLSVSGGSTGLGLGPVLFTERESRLLLSGRKFRVFAGETARTVTPESSLEESVE